MEPDTKNPIVEEVEKSPEELLLDEIYDKTKSKQDRADLLKNKLTKERESFYELDFFLKNYFSHIVENFNEEEDEELFKDLTNTVLDDMKITDCKLTVGGKSVDIFDTTFNGDNKSYFGILHTLTKERRFNLIPLVLDCIVRKDLNDKINVNVVDKSNRSFLYYICSFGFAEKAFNIYIEFKNSVKFDVETLMFDDHNIKVSLKNS